MCSINFKQTWEWFNPINSRFAGWTSRTSHPFGCSNCQRQPSPCLSSQPLDASITGSVQVRPCPAAVKPAQWLKVGCTYSSRAPGAYWTPPRSHGLVGNLLIVGTMQWGGFTVYQGDGIKLLPCTVFYRESFGFWGKLLSGWVLGRPSSSKCNVGCVLSLTFQFWGSIRCTPVGFQIAMK